MEILRHPGYVEVRLPELFDLERPYENLSRALTAVQPGSHNLLIDVSGRSRPLPSPDDSDLRHLCRNIADALAAMTDLPELLALLARPSQVPVLRLYLARLEQLGYGMRLFTDRHQAESWLRTD